MGQARYSFTIGDTVLSIQLRATKKYRGGNELSVSISYGDEIGTEPN